MKKTFFPILFLFTLLFSSTCFADTAAPAKKETTSLQLPHSEGGGENTEEEDNSRFFDEFIKMLFTLGLIVGALYFFKWMFQGAVSRKIEKGNQTGSLKILEKRIISAKTTLYVLDIHNHTYTIAESINGVTLLSEKKGQKKEEIQP